MSYGTRKAIAGGLKGERIAHEGVLEAIAKFDACNTREEIAAVLNWSKQRGGWFLRTAEDDQLLCAAYERAKLRAAS